MYTYNDGDDKATIALFLFIVILVSMVVGFVIGVNLYFEGHLMSPKNNFIAKVLLVLCGLVTTISVSIFTFMMVKDLRKEV